MRKNLVALTVSLLAIPAFANAADLGLANSFGAFIFGNASTQGGHSDGAVAVGGNWAGSGYELPQSSTGTAKIGAYDKIGMYVGGSVDFTNGGSLNNGTAHVGGNFVARNYFNVNGTAAYVGGTYTGNNKSSKVQTGTQTVDPTVFTTQKAVSVAQSNAIKALGGTAIDTSNANNLKLTVGGGQQVFTINAADLGSLRTLDISGIGPTSTVIINVLGTTVNGFGLTVNTNTSGYDKLLWNFADATFINVDQRAFHGSILAPLATVDQRQNIDGTLIATNWNSYNGTELHYGLGKTFTGNVQATPEPMTMALCAAGGVAGFLRRRKATLGGDPVAWS